MVKRTILFRADGDPIIGMGHFIRTLALAEMLNKHFYCIFATRKPTEYQITEINKVCHGQIELPEDNSHFNQFLTYLKGDEIVVLDNYYFTTEYQKTIQSIGCKLVCIDDMHDKYYVADIVINHAEGINPKNFSVGKNTKLLLGFKYALIRKVFRETGNQNFDKKYTCLIMMGGADPFNLTSRITNFVVDMNFENPIAVVINSLSNDEKTKKSEKQIYFKNQTAPQLVDLMQSSLFGIFPASTVAIEAIAVRLPFICGYFVENQINLYNVINRKNLALCINDFSNSTEKDILNAIKKASNPDFVNNLMKNQIKYMDNQSEKRMISEFQNL